MLTHAFIVFKEKLELFRTGGGHSGDVHYGKSSGVVVVKTTKISSYTYSDGGQNLYEKTTALHHKDNL